MKIPVNPNVFAPKGPTHAISVHRMPQELWHAVLFSQQPQREVTGTALGAVAGRAARGELLAFSRPNLRGGPSSLVMIDPGSGEFYRSLSGMHTFSWDGPGRLDLSHPAHRAAMDAGVKASLA